MTNLNKISELQKKINHAHLRLASITPEAIDEQADLTMYADYDDKTKCYCINYEYYDGRSIPDGGNGWDEPAGEEQLTTKGCLSLKNADLKEIYNEVKWLISNAKYNEDWQDNSHREFADMQYENIKCK